ncbi:ATP-binding cassette domain-containing protein [Conexibacter sp. SYSU D00693]|uniref:ABC transporter ATP-binding protein n=1 Tax=Conexibacter sp. SYSU D00693 TaxID=2812560 RepID=UPI00196AFD29|nr:ATP-binding cassette domain-containing protein [Conexibacter sp. SYSU D00693]
MPRVLDAQGLAVVRGRREVLRDVDVELAAGDAVHLAGANGSGKTSLLRVLAGLADARRGRVQRHGTWAFVPEKVALAPAIRGGEWLAAMRRLRGLEPVDWATAAAASGLDPRVLDRPSATCSKGMVQRLALLEALDAGCPLLFLDEPFAGLDADGRDWLAAELTARVAEGAAALLTDHSGAAGGRLELQRGLVLRDGGCAVVEAGTAAAPARRTTVVAVHPTQGTLRRAVAPDAVDGLLRSLLDDGWHVHEVRP